MSIDTPNIAYSRMATAWALTDALWGDTPAMREARTTYLPARKGEFLEGTSTTNQAYATRLNETTLVNYFRPAVQGLSGKVFQKPIIIGENIKAKLEWWNDVDLAGSNINDFAKEIFEQSIRHGLTYILVDAPDSTNPVDEDGNERQKTLAEQIRANERPYLTHVRADQVLGWNSERINNVEVLTEVRIKEVIIETDDDYNQSQVTQIRKIYKNFNEDGTEAQGCTWEIHQQIEGNWEVVDSGSISLNYIPLVPIYTNKVAYMEAETYFTTLCYLNLQHWQSSSYQRNILNVVRVPRMYGFGFTAEEIEQFEKHGVKQGIFSTQPANEVETGWAEAKGDSIQHGERDLANIEGQMSERALDPIMKKATNTDVATIANLEASKSNSVLQQWAESLQSGLKTAIAIMYEMAGEGVIEPDLKVNDDYKVFTDVDKRSKELREDFGLGVITQRTLLTEKRRMGLYDDDFDVEKEIKNTQNELLGAEEFE